MARTDFPTLLQAKVPEQMGRAVEVAALARSTTVSEYIRTALGTLLRLDGMIPEPAEPRDAGTLYDTVDGKRCWALLKGNEIAVMSYYAIEPKVSDYAPGRGDRVLPVYHVDSEPFNIITHWRLPPVNRVEADRVVQEYPIVPKSLEFA